MAQRKRKEHKIIGKRKRKNPADSAGTDGVIRTGYHVLHELQNKPNRNK